MQSKLSDLVDSLSEINKKECPKCMGKNQIKSECDFIGLENNRLCYRCKEYKNKCYKSINGLIKKFPRIYQFCNGEFNKFVLLLRKVFIPMNIWIAGKYLMKLHYSIKSLLQRIKSR